MFEARQRVIYGDTDQMGVVYYANYLRYFEHARNELFRALGGTYLAFEAQGLMLPVVEAVVHYRAPARYDDLLLIGAQVSAASRVRLTFVYEVRREGESVLLCFGHTVHACLTREGKPARLPPHIAQLVGNKGDVDKGEP
ncbi:MAG: acyl-CoA thioesterase [Myxococcaceae bacterium]